MTKRTPERRGVWEYRQEFLQAAQQKVPAIGRYLRCYRGRAYDSGPRRQLIRAWQSHFNLHPAWAFDCAWATLAMWDRFPEHRQTLQWFAAPRSRNLAEEGHARFVFQIERDFHPGLDFGWFKESVHGVLEEQLERFGAAVGADDFTERRRPRELGRAFECLALRICQELSPAEIRRAPEYSRDWTTLFKDMQAAAELIGIRLPGRGRPPKKLAR